ncbi:MULTISPECIES: hypothetical protein [Sphingomonas]|uniref:hypothetical protein n=1 Tax=Sphingomonas TaxID=13687 RepID=UPI00254C8B57|nr:MULTISPECIES: hypothetical protein [Sphingomonas]MDK8188408.1 hypothetical protein [Sphingomonas zeae]MDK8217825.1 hypothetical protein [Sphingomonas sp. UMB7805-LC452B]
MADQIPDSTKRDAIDILTTYADFIRNDVRADDFERHPYLPHIEQTIEDLRAAPPAMDREAVERMVALVEALSDVPRDTVLGQSGYASEARSIRAALSTLSADAIRQGEGDRYASDAAAKALYDSWSDRPGWVPWVERGNSDMQERARREVAL